MGSLNSSLLLLRKINDAPPFLYTSPKLLPIIDYDPNITLSNMPYVDGKESFSKIDIIKFLKIQKNNKIGFGRRIVRTRKCNNVCRFLITDYFDNSHHIDKKHICSNNTYLYKSTDKNLIFKNNSKRGDNTLCILKDLSSRNIAVSLGISLMKLLSYIKTVKKRNINVCIKDKKVFIEVEGHSVKNNYLNFMDIVKLRNQFISEKNNNTILIDHISDDLKFKIALPPLRMFPRRYFVSNITLPKCTQ